jgi:hypothetical protein
MGIFAPALTVANMGMRKLVIMAPLCILFGQLSVLMDAT